MKKLYSKLENTIYYGFSRTFWHIVSLIGVLVIIGGVLVFVWSIIPPNKKEIVKQDVPTKPTYPEPVNVSFEDVYQHIPKEASKIEEERTEINNQPQQVLTNNNSVDPEGLAAFNLQIAKLKTTILEKNNMLFWKGKGHYIYLDERRYKLTKRETYRRFEYTSPGFESKFVKYTDRKNIKDYSNKASLLQALNNLLLKIDNTKRIQLLEQFMSKSINDLNQSINNLNSIATLLVLFPKEDVLNAFENLYNLQNSKASSVAFLSSFLSNFSIEERYTTLKTIKSEINSYNSNFDEFKNITNNFIPLLSKFPQNQQALALKYYYKAYKFKNQDRLNEINQIDQNYFNLTKQIEEDYLSQVTQEEANFYIKKAAKTDFKLKSIYGVGIGIAVIIVITMVLLMLAMIRNVNKLAQVVLETKNTESE